jgi:hypothetical protein
MRCNESHAFLSFISPVYLTLNLIVADCISLAMMASVLVESRISETMAATSSVEAEISSATLRFVHSTQPQTQRLPVSRWNGSRFP